MEVLYKKAAIEDINTLTEIRIKVLRAANELPETTDIGYEQGESGNFALLQKGTFRRNTCGLSGI